MREETRRSLANCIWEHSITGQLAIFRYNKPLTQKRHLRTAAGADLAAEWIGTF